MHSRYCSECPCDCGLDEAIALGRRQAFAEVAEEAERRQRDAARSRLMSDDGAFVLREMAQWARERAGRV